MNENEANISEGLDELLNSGSFKVMGKKKHAKPKSKAITISSTGVMTFNTNLKGSLYRAGKNVSIRINPDANQLLIIVGENIDDANGVVGETNPAVSAINVLRSAEKEYGIEILPNAKKWSSYRYEEGHGLKIIQEDEEALAILLDLNKKVRNKKLRGKIQTFASELSEDDKSMLGIVAPKSVDDENQNQKEIL